MAETRVDTEIADILESEYYSLGIESGSEAIINLLDDFYHHRFDGNIQEWQITNNDLMLIIAEVIVRLHERDGKK